MKHALLAATITLGALAGPAFAAPGRGTFNQLSQTPPAVGPGASSPLFNNDRGTFTGTAIVPDAVTPAPEPAEWALMLAGLAVVGWTARRRMA